MMARNDFFFLNSSLEIMCLLGSIPSSLATAVSVSHISSANVHPHIVSVKKKILILYAANVPGSGDNFIFCNKFTKTNGGIIKKGGQIQISVSVVDSGAKLYSSVNHDGKTVWLVWQDKTGQNILGQAFDEFLDPIDSEKVLLNTATGNLKLYGNSGRISASIVDFDITYKETENGVEKTFIASFTKQGV